MFRLIRSSAVAVLLVLGLPLQVLAGEPILVGLDADMSSGAAEGGEAIRRGAILAIDEINGAGGVLGRPLKLEVRDHRGNPSRGVDNIRELSGMPGMVAVMGGVHTPVVLKELPLIHEKQLVFLVPWAAGTIVVDNKYDPNYVFRVSVRDQYAGKFLVDYSLAEGDEKLGLILEKTGWGRSNEAAIKSALGARGLKPVGVEWFGWGIEDLSSQIAALRDAGAERIILVANPREGGVAAANMAVMPKERQIPILSHWGITGGDFFADNKAALNKIDLEFLQTFSFFDPPVPDRGQHLLDLYKARFPDVAGPEDIFSPVGTAHAYDLIHLLAKAIDKAGTTDRPAVRDAMESLPFHAGVMRDYAPPFAVGRHDALDATSFRIAHYGPGGAIRPVGR